MAAQQDGGNVFIDSSMSDDGSLCEEQIQALLQGAEDRLRQYPAPQPKPHDEGSTSLPMIKVDSSIQPCLGINKGVARVNPMYLRKQQDHALAGKIRTVESNSARKQQLKKEKEATAGPSWFNLPRTNLTSELKRDLQLLSLRSVLDPKRHYKKQTFKAGPPAFSQVGAIIEAPAEYYSARLSNKQRKKTLADEVLAVEAENHRFKSAYAKVQVAKTSGKKGFYKVVKMKRSGGSK